MPKRPTDLVMELLHKNLDLPFTMSEIVKHTGLSISAVRNATKQLSARREIKRGCKGIIKVYWLSKKMVEREGFIVDVF